MHLLNTVRATFLTLKRTRALWLAIAAPLFILCFRTLIYLFGRDANIARDVWNFWLDGNSEFWFGLLLPLALALDIALLVDIDRAAQGWKYLFALPVSRTSVYIAKLIVALVLSVTSGAVLLSGSLVVGYLLAFIVPQLGFLLTSPDILYYLKAILLETLASCFIIAIYLWLSMRTKNFILPACLGIASTVLTIIGYDNDLLQKFSPWVYALGVARILSKLPETKHYLGWSLPIILAISIAGTICMTLLGIIEFNRRDIY